MKGFFDVCGVTESAFLMLIAELQANYTQCNVSVHHTDKFLTEL